MVRIALTDKGEKLTPRMIGSATVSQVFSSLSQEEKLQFHAYLKMLYSEAVNKFAIDFKTMLPAPYTKSQESEIDIRRVLKRTSDILTDITITLNDAGPDKIKSDTEKTPVTNLVKAALKSKTFSPEKLRQLNEYLENLRHATPRLGSSRRSQLPSRQYDEGELESALWRKIRRTHDIIIRISDKEMASHGFSAKLASVLLAIKTLGNKATSSEIARWRLRNASTMSSFLKRLEKQGLVRKLNSPRKSQPNRMALTEKGEKYFSQAMAAESIVQIFSMFSPEELAQLNSYLKKIRERAIKELVQLNPGPD
ncbi:MAG: MarR family winged helix-turn-helix transcriptional regulator [Chloroflexota bacterium]